MSKIKPIIRGNVIVWPKIPQARDPGAGTLTNNIVVLPVVHVTAKSEPSYNDIQKIVAKTMRGQRVKKHNPHVIEKLRATFIYPA